MTPVCDPSCRAEGMACGYGRLCEMEKPSGKQQLAERCSVTDSQRQGFTRLPARLPTEPDYSREGWWVESSPSLGLLCALWGLASSQDEEESMFSFQHFPLKIILRGFFVLLLLLLFNTYMFAIFQVSMIFIHSLILGPLGCCL